MDIGAVGMIFAKASEIEKPDSKIKKGNRFNLNYCLDVTKWGNGCLSPNAKFCNMNYLLYEPIKQRVGKETKIFKKYDFYQERYQKKKKKIKKNAKIASLTPTIGSISPDTITAGTSSVLTINGTNFDSTTMKIQFLNANNGGAILPATGKPDVVNTPKNHIKSWSSTKIEVYVPSVKMASPLVDVFAGSGSVGIQYKSASSGSVILLCFLHKKCTLNTPFAI